jgi:hypothetical protein
MARSGEAAELDFVKSPAHVRCPQDFLGLPVLAKSLVFPLRI